MSKVQHGDPKIDAKIKGIIKSLKESVTSKNLMNCDTKTLRDLKLAADRAAALAGYYTSVRVEQQFGGHKGGSKKEHCDC